MYNGSFAASFLASGLMMQLLKIINLITFIYLGLCTRNRCVEGCVRKEEKSAGEPTSGGAFDAKTSTRGFCSV